MAKEVTFNSDGGESLVFLISQPRAGSTLCQCILGSHSEIYTTSEPWIMLPPLYALSENSINGYNSKLGKIGWHQFMQNQGTEELYYEGLRVSYCKVYKSVLETTEKKLFLDKTPRYYNIVPELFRTFPKAKFIILLRNPVAVLCSIVTTWMVYGYYYDWLRLEQYRDDLLLAPRLLLEGINTLGNSCCVIHYSDVVQNPFSLFQEVCRYLNLPFNESMIDYGNSNFPVWRFGDQKMVHQRSRPDEKNMNKWISRVQEPVLWRAASNYLELLTSDTVEDMGYSYNDIRKVLDSNRPSMLRMSTTVLPDWLK